MQASLYIHVPFCRHKCPYCHFFVLPSKEAYHKQYVHAWQGEWKQKLPLLSQKEIVSIYFGGGTPPLIGLDNLSLILKTILKDVTVSRDCEITLEANPEDITVDFIKACKDLGFNRVSLGIQSLDDSSLDILDRRHSAKKAIEAVLKVDLGGIKNISIDLMYELPGQTLESWKKTLSQIPELPISHLSLYNLTIEPNTAFYKRQATIKPTLPSEETNFEMLQHACSFFETIGLKRYEISAFAKNDLVSKHNTGYWLARPFLGLGPSAYSYFGEKRFRNIANLQKYAKLIEENSSPVDFEEKLEYPDNLHELLAVQIRLLQGVNLSAFQEKQGRLPQKTLEVLSDLERKGMLEMNNDIVKLSEKGLLFYDSVAVEII